MVSILYLSRLVLLHSHCYYLLWRFFWRPSGYCHKKEKAHNQTWEWANFCWNSGSGEFADYRRKFLQLAGCISGCLVWLGKWWTARRVSRRDREPALGPYETSANDESHRKWRWCRIHECSKLNLAAKKNARWECQLTSGFFYAGWFGWTLLFNNQSNKKNFYTK